jgi:hypothetical protein
MEGLMTRFTQSDIDRLNSKNSRQPIPVAQASERRYERDLHDEILTECARRRFYVVHSRMDRATTQAKGVTDFIIAMPDSKTLWVECKRKGSKMTPEQNVTAHVLKALGHRHAVVHTLAEFIALLG